MGEYVGLDTSSPDSYYQFMHENFFKHIDIPPHNINLLNGNATDLTEECKRYEEKIKSYNKINLFVGEIGVDGHIAFNKPTSSLNSRTRVQYLTSTTRQANARFLIMMLEKYLNKH